MLVDITIKNTGDETHPTEDFLYGMEVRHEIEGSGYQIYGYYYDTEEEIKPELAPGEETSGQFIGETYEGDTYYLRLRPSIAESGASNQVTWIIPTEEVTQE